MASDQNFVDFVLEQMGGTISCKKMFGEYGIYAQGKFFGVICNNQLFIKPTSAGRKFIHDPMEISPYKGAKPYFLIGEKIEDRQWLSKLINLTLAELPAKRQKIRKQ